MDERNVQSTLSGNLSTIAKALEEEFAELERRELAGEKMEKLNVQSTLSGSLSTIAKELEEKFAEFERRELADFLKSLFGEIPQSETGELTLSASGAEKVKNIMTLRYLELSKEERAYFLGKARKTFEQWALLHDRLGYLLNVDKCYERNNHVNSRCRVIDDTVTDLIRLALFLSNKRQTSW